MSVKCHTFVKFFTHLMQQKTKKRPTKVINRPPRRKLKKSVKRGCSGCALFVLFVVLFFVSSTVYECKRSAQTSDAPPALSYWEEMPPDATDSLMAQCIDKLVHTPLRIDTAQLAISVYDLQTRATVYRYHHTDLLPPASCMKLLSATTALKGLGLDHSYDSRLYTTGAVSGGVLKGDVLLFLDDDPEVTTLKPFAQALQAKRISRIDGHCYVHLMRHDTLRQHPTAMPWDIPYRKLSLLLKGERVVQRDWQSALKAHHITAPDAWSVVEDSLLPSFSQRIDSATLIYRHVTPMLTPMTPMLTNSSNIKAESIFYHTEHHQPRWEEDAHPYTVSQFIREEMQLEPDSFVVNDGSGLSPQNRLSAHFLTRLLIYVYNQEEMWKVMIHRLLATPGAAPRRGSLTNRMSNPKYRGKIYCKTGTLTTCGVSSLSGYAQGKDGRWYAFSIMNNNTSVYESRHFQDLVCKVLIGASQNPAPSPQPSPSSGRGRSKVAKKVKKR